MMRLFFVLLISGMLVNGAHACETAYKELLRQNNDNLTRLNLGMSKDELVQLMTDCSTHVKGKPFTNPFKVDAWQRGSDTYEVMYYLTRRYQKFTPVRESHTTPVVLKNGKVTGWGRAALEDLTATR
jgi:hypothetical protein